MEEAVVLGSPVGQFKPPCVSHMVFVSLNMVIHTRLQI